MSFLAAKFLYFLLLIPALVGLKAWADWRAGRVQEAFAAPRLRDSLISGISRGRSWLIFSLQLIALAAFIIALARPVWGEDKIVQQESGRNIIIAIDTSRSMLANDVLPDRLTRAKLAIQDLLPALKDDRVGLIAFAGNSYLQAPLTTDHDAVIEAVQSLDFTSVPRGGSELGRALKLAIDTFEKSPARNHGLILFSDGGEPDAEIATYAQQAAKKNVLVLTVGVGTEAGSLIPDPDPERAGDFIRDQEGNVVKTRLVPGALQEIATATRGRYLKLGSQPLATSVVRDLVVSLQAQTNAARELVKPIERFYWPLSIGVLFLIAAWFVRPTARMKTSAPLPTVFALLVSVLIAPDMQAAQSQESWFSSIFQPRQQEPVAAHQAYERGKYDEAAELYEELLEEKPSDRLRSQYAFGLGASAHQLKDYDRAIGGFSQALESSDSSVQNQAHRGLAHSLYDQGDKALAKQPKFTLKAWRDSVKHFDASLAIDPENKEVKENREFVQKRLDQLQQQMNQQQQGGKGNKGDKKKGNKGKKGEKGQKGEGEEGEQGENGDEEGEGEGEEDKSRKESLGKKEGEEEGKGEGDQQKEGQLQAGEQGKEESPEARAARERREAEMAENQENEATGFSRNEARSFLRTYADDQKKAMIVRPRDEPVRGKDW
jgi:Ca-activated chloride channel family protein